MISYIPISQQRENEDKILEECIEYGKLRFFGFAHLPIIPANPRFTTKRVALFR